MAFQEKSYTVAEMKNGEMVVVIEFRGASPENPVIFYDGGHHALFHRSHEISVILDYLHPEVRQKLKDRSDITVLEVENDVVMVGYNVPVRMKSKLPINDDSIETLGEEEESLLDVMLADLDRMSA